MTDQPPTQRAPHEPTGGGLRPALAHPAGALLTGCALFFSVWALAINPRLPAVFGSLAGDWAWGGAAFDWPGLLAGMLTVALCLVLGWFALENVEVYLPRSAAAALALIFGLGLAGFVLECLAIPFWLGRRTIAGALGLLLAILAVGAWRRASRPTESGLGGEAGREQQRLRQAMARAAHTQSIEPPRGLHERAFRVLATILIAAIAFFNFWHALLYPEVYWDSLILYLGYARMTYLEHGFPIKVTGQVGIGLGANYPHLFSVIGSGAATALGAWSELPQRLIAPLCGVASTVLIYHTALRLTRRVNAALAFALLYCSVPLGIAYTQYASDYALALLFAAAFFYLALRAIESGLRGYLILSALLIALSMHLNYLMGILWLSWGITLWAAQAGWPRALAEDEATGEEIIAGADPDAPWTALPRRPGVRGLLAARWLWLTLLLAVAVGSTWYVRNWRVTGNPVYAFFYETLGGRNINPAVMKASEREWQANGAGIGRFTEQITASARAAFEARPPTHRIERWLNPVEDNRLSRLRLLPEFLLGSHRWNKGYRLMPLIGAFSIGGSIVWLGMLGGMPLRRGRRTAGGADAVRRRIAFRFGGVVVSLTVALFAFHVVLAPFYLYQIIKLIPCLTLLAALAWPVWRGKPWRWALGGLALWIGLVPGLAMAMMGFKVFMPELYALRNPMPEARRFYGLRFGEDARMWEYVNQKLHGRAILTHENRHLVFDPSIRMVHLDDWEIQPLWELPDPAERVRRLTRDFDIQYYLYVPNEDATPTNALMGAKAWADMGLATLEYETADPPNRLYRLTPPAETDMTPRDP